MQVEILLMKKNFPWWTQKANRICDFSGFDLCTNPNGMPQQLVDRHHLSFSFLAFCQSFLVLFVKMIKSIPPSPPFFPPLSHHTPSSLSLPLHHPPSSLPPLSSTHFSPPSLSDLCWSHIRPRDAGLLSGVKWPAGSAARWALRLWPWAGCDCSDMLTMNLEGLEMIAVLVVVVLFVKVLERFGLLADSYDGKETANSFHKWKGYFFLLLSSYFFL